MLKNFIETFVMKYNRVGKAHSEPDQTLEVLMMDLDPEKIKWFWKDICPTASEATKVRELG